jgi:hypothetical protein
MTEQEADRGPQPGSPAGVVVATWSFPRRSLRHSRKQFLPLLSKRIP